ncbi:hypothetical protein ACN2EN_01480 [Aliarcobacter lanthieri]|uniref:hypothetical protein n=1 Tax=Aliarcobacter lanthieri TaxID=1355374 RepID=UPI003AFAD125
MYIKSFFKYQTSYLDEKEYKKLLKPLISMDLRRVSKFNLLALYGSVNILNSKNFDKNLFIYVATNLACIDETYKVLCEIKDKNPIMPFDFLNINTNNTGFYISKALEIDANSYTISTNDLAFERALELAFFDYKNGVQKSFLIGSVENSSQNIPNQSSSYFDNSSWIYFDNKEENSLSKIKTIKYFTNIDELNFYLCDLQYDNIILNDRAKEFLNELNIDKNSLNSEFDIFSIFEKDLKNSIYIAFDSKKRAYLINFGLNSF